jgi:large subunit ribosomal protein L25
MLSITIEKRDKTQKLDAIRKAGKLPAVFYGRKEASTMISVAAAEFLKIWKKAGESSVIELKGLGDHEALIKDVDQDPVTDVVRHVDFYVIEKGKKLEVSVPLHFVGVSPAVKDLGGILVKVLYVLKIEALPKDLPTSIEVDISGLATFESQILAKDLKFPAGVELKENPEEVVASVAKPVRKRRRVQRVQQKLQQNNSLSNKKQKTPYLRRFLFFNVAFCSLIRSS